MIRKIYMPLSTAGSAGRAFRSNGTAVSVIVTEDSGDRPTL